MNRQEKADRILALSVALVLALALAVYSYKATAQNNWVDQLKNQHGAICCHNNDGMRLADPDWDTLGKVAKDANGPSGYRVLDESAWKDVMNWAVVSMKNFDGIARVWFYLDYQLNGTTVKRVKCFLPGVLG